MTAPLLSIAELQVFLGVVLAVWTLTPRPSLSWVRLGGLPKINGMAEPQRRKNAFGFALRQLAILMPHGRWSAEFREAPVYPGSTLTIEEFRGVKVLSIIAFLLVYFAVTTEFRIGHPAGPLAAAGLGLVLPIAWLKGRIAKRNRSILRLLPEVIDLLSLCVGAGVDFLGALNRVVTVREYRREPLIEEFSIALQEMKLGKRKSDALKAMGRRVNLQELTSFVRAIVLADRMGTPIADVLAVHAEDVRMQRYNRAEREALKAPIKLLLPLVFGIMPCVGIVVGAPVFLQFMRMNPFQAMGQ